MTAKVLVPVDFSPMTESVVSWAASVARDRKASLILLHVQEPIAENLTGEMYFPMPLQENPEVRRKLMAVVPDDPAIACEHRLLLGAAPDLILKLADEEQVDLIVMGSHGRGWLGRLLMGSVAEHVMRHANRPVLIVNQQCAQSCETNRSPEMRLSGRPTRPRRICRNTLVVREKRKRRQLIRN